MLYSFFSFYILLSFAHLPCQHRISGYPYKVLELRSNFLITHPISHKLSNCSGFFLPSPSFATFVEWRFYSQGNKWSTFWAKKKTRQPFTANESLVFFLLFFSTPWWSGSPPLFSFLPLFFSSTLFFTTNASFLLTIPNLYKKYRAHKVWEKTQGMRRDLGHKGCGVFFLLFWVVWFFRRAKIG